MIIRIGGISVNLLVRENAAGPRTDRIMEGLRERLSHFIVRGDRHDFSLVIRPADDLPWAEILGRDDLMRVRRIARILEGRFPFGKILFDDGHKKGQKVDQSSMNRKMVLPILSRFDGGAVSVIPRRGLLLAVDHTTGHGEVVVKGTDEQALIPSLVNALQGVLALCAPDHGALMLHASSLAFDGGGYLFLGGSGAGKSTIAASVPPETALSDDGSWCRRDDGAFFLFPTPFSQINPGPASTVRAPLMRALFLEKSGRNYVAELSRGRAMTMLLLNHIHFFRFMYREGALRAFGLVGDLCRTHPFSTLFFSRNFNPIPFFRETADERKEAV